MSLNNSEPKPAPPSEVSGWWLVAAFLYFMILSAAFVSIFGYESVYLGPQVIFILFVSYLPLVVVPWQAALQTSAGIKFLGLSRADFIKTLPYGVAAFLIAGLWQSGIFGYTNIAYHPKWDIVPLSIGIVLLGIVIPLAEIKMCRRYNLVPGLVTLSFWSIYTFYFPWGDEETFEHLFKATQNEPNFLLIAFLISFAVPFAEEFYFRGFILRYFTNRCSPFLAIAATSLLFGLVHMHPALIISLTLYSIPLGMMVYYSRSIYPAIWAHVGLNLSASITVWLYAQYGAEHI